MSQPHRFTFQPYAGPSSKYTCPQCGQKRVLCRYVDTETGELLPEHVGRCDRADKCGYHFTPRDYFQNGGTVAEGTAAPRAEEPPRPVFLHPKSRVLAFRAHPELNTLSNYFRPIVDAAYGLGRWDIVSQNYALGTQQEGPLKGAAVFWQVDAHGNVHAGKEMLYDPTTGKRRKDVRSQSWVHYEDHHLSAGDLNVQQCLFGEHLLPQRPEAPVAVVESEKTALIGAACVPTMIWVATGSLGEFKLAKLQALTGRHVVAFPDLSIESKAFKQWSATAYELRGLFASVHVSDLLEAGATVESTLAGDDIADYLLRAAVATEQEPAKPSLPERILSEAEKAMRRMAKRNPAINTLVDVLGLDLTTATIARNPTSARAA